MMTATEPAQYRADHNFHAALALGQVLSMVRLVVGPTSADRILALDTMVINALGLVVVLGIYQGVHRSTLRFRC